MSLKEGDRGNTMRCGDTNECSSPGSSAPSALCGGWHFIIRQGNADIQALLHDLPKTLHSLFGLLATVKKTGMVKSSIEYLLHYLAMLRIIIAITSSNVPRTVR